MRAATHRRDLFDRGVARLERGGRRGQRPDARHKSCCPCRRRPAHSPRSRRRSACFASSRPQAARFAVGLSRRRIWASYSASTANCELLLSPPGPGYDHAPLRSACHDLILSEPADVAIDQHHVRFRLGRGRRPSSAARRRRSSRASAPQIVERPRRSTGSSAGDAGVQEGQRAPRR